MNFKNFLITFGASIIFIFSILFIIPINSISNAQNLSNSNIYEYRIENSASDKKATKYSINYPIFENQNLNENIYLKIQKILEDFENEYAHYEKDTQPEKASLNLETDIGFFENYLFIRFFISRNYLGYPNQVQFYESYIFDLNTGNEVNQEDLFEEYSLVLISKAKEYFKNNYGLTIDKESEEYFNRYLKLAKYHNIFIKKDYFEFIIFDYKKNEDVIIRAYLEELKPYIKQIDNTQNLTETETTQTIIIDKEDNIETTTNIENLEQIQQSLNENLKEQQEKSDILKIIEPIKNLNKSNEFKDIIIENVNKILAKVSEIEKQKEILRQQEELKINKYNIDPNKPMIALTFDDGPNSKTTNKILDILEKNNARATFFVVGRIDKEIKTLKRINELGNEIGNHTINHKNLANLSEEQIAYEIEGLNKKLKKYIGNSAKIVRVPYGSTNEKVIKNVKYPIILWDVDTRDWETKNKNSIISQIRKNTKDGSIILMHDLYDSTVQACEVIIPELIKKGYQLVTVSELMKYKGIELKNGVKYYNTHKKR